MLHEAAAIDGAGRLAAVPARHAAAAAADDPLRLGDDDHRVPAVLRGAVRHDQRWPAQQHHLDVACTRTSSSASATTGTPRRSSYIIFVVIAVVTALQFRAAPREHLRPSMTSQPRAAGGSTSSSPSRVLAVAAPFVWMFLGSFKSTTRAAPESPRPGGRRTPSLDNYTQLFSTAELRRLLHELHDRRRHRHRGQPALLLDGRLRAGRCSTSRARSVLFVIVLGTLMIPGVVTFVPLFVLVGQRRAGRHPARAVPAVPGQPRSASS